MLAVRDCDAARLTVPGLDAGAAAVAVAHSWAEAGRRVLLVDADAHGIGLSGRIGAAARVAVPPARRGLPSLIASRASPTAETVAGHCWLLPSDGDGSVQLLGAPAHPDGAHRSASWLADRAAEIAALADRWAVIVAMPGPTVPSYKRLLSAASQCLMLTVAPGVAPPGGLRAVLSAFWLHFAPDPELKLLTFGVEDADPETSAAEISATLIGGVNRARPAALLGARSRRRDRVLGTALADAATQLGTAADRSVGPERYPAGSNGLSANHCTTSTATAADGRTPGRLPSGAGS